jgi:hypothetical protein
VQVVEVVIMLAVMMLRPANLPDQIDHCCSLSLKFCWWLLLFLLLLLFQTTFEWCVLMCQSLVIICFNQDRLPENRDQRVPKLTFSYILGQGGTEFDLQSKSYGKWTIYDDINELALNNYTNLIRNGSKTWVWSS